MPPVTGIPALYWNRQGQVNCAEHAPYRGSDTWQNEGWRKVAPTKASRGNALLKQQLAAMTCETCRAITTEKR